MTTAHINHSAGAIACILKYYDLVQLSLDMPDESAKGYTSGAKANQQRMRNVGVISQIKNGIYENADCNGRCKDLP